jgi:hypothetical protein
MTVVEELILQNQVCIMSALVIMMDDGDDERREAAELTLKAARLTQEKMEAWGQSSR